MDEQQFRNEVYDYLMLSSPHSQVSTDVIRLIANGIRCNSIFFLKNTFSQKVGFAIYSRICNESVVQNVNWGIEPQYPYEWNEGEIIWIRYLHIREGAFEKNIRKTFRNYLRNKIVYVNFGKSPHFLLNSSKLNVTQDGTYTTKKLEEDLQELQKALRQDEN